MGEKRAVKEVKETQVVIYSSYFYKLDNGPLLDKWTEILGKPKPFKQYDPNMIIKVRIIKRYFDLILQRTVECKEVLEVSCMRASKLMSMELAVKEEE